MPTAKHEALHRIFREDSSLFARTFKLLDIAFPSPCAVSVMDTDLTELEPVARRADTLLYLESEQGDHVLVIESQSREDKDKAGSWAYYIGYLHARHTCPVTLLVVCHDLATARWARRPKGIGLEERPSLVLHPIVLGPDNVPAITDLAQASEDVVLAVFSALTHGRSPQVTAILEVLAAALDTVDTQTAGYFAEFTEVGLGDTDARYLWRALMSTKTYRYQSEYAQQIRAEGEARGEARGEAKALLRVLHHRGVPVPPVARERIMSCSDTDLLEAWLDRALNVTTADELFG
ncbi:hypothetical protein GCM10010149_82840 [Nonomuraea roseoviolacea subsp. roseoviolacea]|uniref:hypothetical protein n=1 Tax=Nonomuraea roseoviolacea TaxID=103837 RepID=UPI0031DDDA8E